MRPLLFVTGHAPPERQEPFRLLAEREHAELALFGGRSRHATGEAGERLPFPHARPSQRAILGLAASGRYRAVICGTVGRTALPAAYLGARRARVPFLLWSALWAQPRTPAGIVGYPLMRHVYRHADAIVTYGSHVSAYVRARGARNVHVAPQAVDNAFWSAAPGERPARPAPFVVLFVGRLAREKGVRVLLDAWRRAGLERDQAALLLVGEGPERRRVGDTEAVALGARSPEEVRNFYALADVVVIASIATAAFREPWGLVANEAMNREVVLIVTDAVGAAAGGLVRHGRTGLVVPAGDAVALAGAIRTLHDDAELRRRLGAAGREAVAELTFARWVDGFSGALASVGVSARGH